MADLKLGTAIGGYLVLHTNNFNIYSPTLIGTGASGTWNISVTGSAGSVANSITFNSSGNGSGSGTTFNGSASGTVISYNTIGAQPLLTNPITGTGNANYLTKFNGTTGITNSNIFDNGTNIGFKTTSPSETLSLIGNIAFGNTEGKAKMIYNSTENSIDFIIN